MKRLLMMLAVVAFGAALTLDTAEAARAGSGKSMGAQRAAPMQRQAQPAAAQAAPKPAQAAPAAAPAGNRWLGPIAGLAAGLGLGWLLGQGGFGGMGGMGGILMMLLLGFAAVMLFRFFMQRRTASAAPMQFAGMGNETVTAPPPSQMYSANAPAGSPANEVQPQIPAGFDVEGFLKQAKLNFVRLQEANDRGNVEALREITTEEMFAGLKVDFLARAGQTQQTDVVTLNASLLEVVTEGNMHWASVRFSGEIRETPNAPAAPFEEVWNLQKPVDGSAGWLLAGIQQVS